MFVESGIATQDPLTLPALINWLEQQPQDKEYSFFDAASCLAAQYNESISRIYYIPNPIRMIAHGFGWKTFDTTLEYLAVEKPWTFGAALIRAKAVL